ncbi:MAG: tRNA 2-selenouridine(34) synthase MnmH [Bacteroidia bacterium]
MAESEFIPIVDVRSPGEFFAGHIPGAVNIPIFDNEERKTVGILYKQRGREEAILKGLEIVGPKMAGFVHNALALTTQKKLNVHCWRGGMRSESMALLWKTVGFEVNVLPGGYKAYRQKVLSDFEQPLQLIVLGGKTGSGKTEILQELKKAGEQIIDLESLACHKGSSFGAIGQLPQPSVEQFENNLHQAFLQLDSRRRIWVEDESHAIGRVYIPHPFWTQMVAAPVMVVEVPLQERVKRLINEYAGAPKEEISDALLRIQKRLGGQQLKQAMKSLNENDFATGAEIALQYYDKTYSHGLSQRSPSQIHTLAVGQDNPKITAIQLIEYCQQLPR